MLSSSGIGGLSLPNIEARLAAPRAKPERSLGMSLGRCWSRRARHGQVLREKSPAAGSPSPAISPRARASGAFVSAGCQAHPQSPNTSRGAATLPPSYISGNACHHDARTHKTAARVSAIESRSPAQGTGTGWQNTRAATAPLLVFFALPVRREARSQYSPRASRSARGGKRGCPLGSKPNTPSPLPQT